MFFAAAKTLAASVTRDEMDRGCLYPDLTRIREISAAIAVSVAGIARARDLTTRPMPDDLEGHVRAQMYVPE